MDLELIKSIGSILVSTGVGTIVSNACAHVRPSDVSRLNKLVGSIGTVALGLCVSDKVTNYFEEKFDKVTEKLKTEEKTNEEET